MTNAPKTDIAHHPMVLFKRDMDAMVARELDMLDDKSKSRMKSAAIVAVTKDPDLLLADRQSFMGSIRMCAQHGVIPDGNEAVLQVYNTKIKGANGQDVWVKKVTYLPMIRGIVNRVQKSGKIKLFYAEVVYAHEVFKIDTTHGDRRPVHEFDPMRRGKDVDVIGSYSVAVWHDGTTDCEPMPREQIEKVKAVAKTKNVWDGWFVEKAKVAVMKRHAKRLPLLAEDMDFILNREETDFDQEKDITPRTTGPNLAQRIAQSVVEPEKAPVEPKTVQQVADIPDAEIAEPADEPHWTDAIDTDAAFPGSEAWESGVKAAQAGMKRTMCPHQDEPGNACDWLGGFDGQRRAEE